MPRAAVVVARASPEECREPPRVRESDALLREMRATTETTIIESRSLMREIDVLLHAPPRGCFADAALNLKRVNYGGRRLRAAAYFLAARDLVF
jgi:hypothetical protein